LPSREGCNETAARHCPDPGTSTTSSPSRIHLVLQSRHITRRLCPNVEIVRKDWQNGQCGAVMDRLFDGRTGSVYGLSD